jgi:cell wall-associated NlpC family hydrolase
MKNAFMTVLRYVVKAIYPLVKAKRYIFKRVKSFFSKSSKRGNSNFPNSVITKTEKTRRYDPHPRTGRRNTYAKPYMSSSSESRTRYRHKKLPIWKDKRVIAGAGALVVIITGVLAVSLPAGGNNVYAGIGAVSSANPSPKTSLETAVPEGSEDPKYVSYNHNNLGSLAGNVSGGITSIIKENPLPEASSLPTTDPLQTPIPTTAPDVMELSPGCHDSRITDIQMRLMELGYMEADEPTDYYGWGTEYSLQLFQRRHNLQIDGIAGKETLTKLFDPDAKPYSVKIKDRGTDVKAIQERLKELRYLKSTANGVFGEDTENAVKAFQKRNGLASDGSVGEMTRESLFSEDAKEAPQPKPSSKPTSKPTTKPKATVKPTSGSGGSNPPVGDPDKASVEELIKVAKSVLGSKYVRGGKGPTTFDCSGLVYYALNKAGRSIGYRTSTQWKSSGLSKVTKMSDMKAGDIIVFKTRHVGIYIGNGLMIDASSSHGKVVQRSCMTDHWKKEFYCAVRVL